MIKLSKRVVVISSAILLVAVVAVYVCTSLQAWSAASNAAMHASSNIKKLVDGTLATETAPNPLRVALDKTAGSKGDASKNNPCQLSLLYEWQSTLPWLKDQRQQCLVSSRPSQDLKKSLEDLQTLLNKEGSAAVLLQKTMTDTAGTANYSSAATSWKKLAEDPSLITKDAFKPVGARIKELAVKISKAYAALVVADVSKDRVSVESAKTNLVDAYGTAPLIKNTSTEVRTVLIDGIIAAYDKL